MLSVQAALTEIVSVQCPSGRAARKVEDVRFSQEHEEGEATRGIVDTVDTVDTVE